MNRKKYIQSQGGTCNNWQYAWSFINSKDKVIIFGAWDSNTKQSASLIFSENWKIDHNGHKRKAYQQSKEHIRLIEEEGYKLKTFPLIFSDEKQDENGHGPAKIKGFIEELSDQVLTRVGGDWYASDNFPADSLPEEVGNPEKYLEGSLREISVNAYERNDEARAKCLEYYGYKCVVCTFDFEKIYGSIGRHFIHVHHLTPLSEIKKEYEVDPIQDLRPVCPNCHSIIHRTQPALSIEKLRQHMAETQASVGA
jgi:5-methylcytosine-specific restriction protein A